METHEDASRRKSRDTALYLVSVRQVHRVQLHKYAQPGLGAIYDDIFLPFSSLPCPCLLLAPHLTKLEAATRMPVSMPRCKPCQHTLRHTDSHNVAHTQAHMHTRKDFMQPIHSSTASTC